MRSIINNIGRSIVTIVRSDNHGRPLNICGGGFFVTKDGVILTCAHIILENNLKDNLIIGYGQTRNKEIYVPSEIIDLDEIYDLALLKTKNNGEVFPVVLGTSDNFFEGLEVLFAGFPLIDNEVRNIPFYNKAIVSSVLQFVADDKTTKFDICILDTLSRAGYSGGPVIDLEAGNVIGIVKASLKESNQTIEKIGLPVIFSIDKAKEKLQSKIA